MTPAQRFAGAATSKGHIQKRGRIAPPPVRVNKHYAKAYLLNSENCSLPTKPNFVTPDPLMMFSTLADRS